MQSQPKSDEPRTGRVQRARQALHVNDDAFKGGGEDSPRLRLGLKRPWIGGRSRLFAGPETGADSE
jgi:hypothetical protein